MLIVVVSAECWDCIVTCFFIDAAPNVIDYIAAFQRMLKPGGYWINLGPLLYHWQNAAGEDDERYGQSIELTYEELKHVMGTYNFKILVRWAVFLSGCCCCWLTLRSTAERVAA